jgi:hypothetical protein
MCGNGGHLLLCSNCPRAICIGPNTECLGLPVTSHFEDDDVSFPCLLCHQNGDRKANTVPTMCVWHHDVPRWTILMTILTSKGFYFFQSPQALCAPGFNSDKTQTWTSGTPVFEYPAHIRGSSRLLPRSKFQSSGVAILNFCLSSFHRDTGDLGKTLEPFASAFFPKERNDLLIFESIEFDLYQSQHKHDRRIQKVSLKLRAARCVPQAGTLVSSHFTDSNVVLDMVSAVSRR